MTKLFLLTYVLFTSIANAGTDPRFSFEAVDSAFQSAVVPSAAMIVGNWVVVGVATGPAWNKNGDGYWPDGKYSLPDQFGQFFTVYQNRENGLDALGNQIFTTSIKEIGAETGREYSVRKLNSSLTSAGFKFHIEYNRTDLCDRDLTCRIVPSIGMLLCQQVFNDNYRTCTNYTGKLRGYVGMMKQP